MQEGDGLAQYNEQTAEIMKVTKGKAVQRVEAASAITLLEDAISEKDTFFAFFREFEAVCRTEGIGLLLVLPKKGDATKCKDLLRVIEKLVAARNGRRGRAMCDGCAPCYAGGKLDDGDRKGPTRAAPVCNGGKDCDRPDKGPICAEPKCRRVYGARFFLVGCLEAQTKDLWVCSRG